jgi:hypothetical protein
VETNFGRVILYGKDYHIIRMKKHAWKEIRNAIIQNKAISSCGGYINRSLWIIPIVE